MDQKGLAQKFSDIGAIITGSHFVYTPKEIPRVTMEAAKYLAEQYVGIWIELVIGPELGAIILAHEVAAEITKISPSRGYHEWGCVRNIYAEKKDRDQEGSPMVIRRGFDKLIPGRNVLVVEDILTSGGSARRTIEAVKALGGDVIGLAALCNRGNVQPEAVGGVPITAIFNVQMPMYPEETCPICIEGKIPVRTDFGKGADFIKRKGK